MRFLPCSSLFLAAALAGSPSVAADSSASPSGRMVGDFSLRDPAGKSWSLANFKDKKAVVVVFLGTECPINSAYLPRLAELHQTFAPKEVQFLAINANLQDTAERVATHAKKYGLPFPVLKDLDQVVADCFGARRTPEAFILDPQRRVCYQGRIDDQFEVGISRPKPTRADLAEALAEVLAGKPVSQPVTTVAGCLITRQGRTPTAGKITYTNQVARILQKNCQECHRPNQIGPMALLTYEDAAAWSATIHEVVSANRMPPWHADPRYGQFANDRRLPKDDRETLLAWIDKGCPQGDPKDLPRARAFADGWRIGQPDAVVEMPEEFKVPAQAPARGVAYQYFVAKTNFPEDRWIQAAEARPGNRAVVHHIIVFVAEPGKPPANREDRIGNGFLVGDAPGDHPAIYRPGMAKKLPKGALLVFQMHYTPNGTAQTDRSAVGMIFAKKPPQLEVRTRAISQGRFLIPAGASNHEVVSRTTFARDTLVFSFMPHMHLRGKNFEYRAIFPDGKEETLLSVPRYDFNWQSHYRLVDPLRLPAGSRIECTAHYDNSANNPNNPDPTKDVRWGDQTWQEMMIGFVDYAYTDVPVGNR